jgi:hypothetical protein
MAFPCSWCFSRRRSAGARPDFPGRRFPHGLGTPSTQIAGISIDSHGDLQVRYPEDARFGAGSSPIPSQCRIILAETPERLAASPMFICAWFINVLWMQKSRA